VKFSERTSWLRSRNRLSRILDRRREDGNPVYDLTCSNPTVCHFRYPRKDILQSLSHPQMLRYRPDPTGILSARLAVAGWYRKQKIDIDPSRLFLTASTSEAYSLVLKLLCNPGDEILVPRPSYPLFEYLAQVNDVTIGHYRMHYLDDWHLDIESIRRNITQKTKAIAVVHPHNPTGFYLKQNDFRRIRTLAKSHGLALIVDEVFHGYPFGKDAERMGSTAKNSDVLTFTLDGLSKLAGLPQMKLGWIVVRGPAKFVEEASGRLEILCDTFLSVNTPVQMALPRLLATSRKTRADILKRVQSNYNDLCSLIPPGAPCSVLRSEGGWYGIIRVPATMPDETWAERILKTTGVYLFPGCFFDFAQEGCLVVSLLVPQSIFRRAVKKVVEFVSNNS
jgi:alanine-synthesizing transaminase